MMALVNLLLRCSIAYFLAEVMANKHDPRFAGKAIPLRNLIIVSGLSLIFPIRYLMRGRRGRYPFVLDNLYLSIFWLDMAGNSFNLYDTHEHFDLIPHFHGTGALTVVLKAGLGLPTVCAAGLATIVHVLLEIQEYYTDVLFGTHNVRGVADTVNDLFAGIVGTLAYGLGSKVVEQQRRRRR